MKTQISVIAILLFVALTLSLKKEESPDATTTNPTNIAHFLVQQLGRDFQLTWATNAEQKDTRLELQKSFNERQFETIQIFKGADRNTLKSYAYTDTTPFERTPHEVKIIYYRLKEVEANQIFTYSKVITIVRDDNYDTPIPTL
jgi:hypothetical protein